MKLIFLDVDGVLNNLTRTCYEGILTEPDSQNLAALRRVLYETGASIVVSSAWRRYGGIRFIHRTLHDWGIMAPILGITSIEGDCARIQRIYAWMNEFEGKIDAYAILDDMDLGTDDPCIVKTHMDVGLTECDADSAIRILSRIVLDGDQNGRSKTQTQSEAA